MEIYESSTRKFRIKEVTYTDNSKKYIIQYKYKKLTFNLYIITYFMFSTWVEYMFSKNSFDRALKEINALISNDEKEYNRKKRNEKIL